MLAINLARRTPLALPVRAAGHSLSTWSNVPSGPPDPILGECSLLPGVMNGGVEREWQGFLRPSRPTKTPRKLTSVSARTGMRTGSLMF